MGRRRRRVCVLGFYGHGNLGDESFKPAFNDLWPEVDFTFSDIVPEGINENYDAVIFGGGSFLDDGIPGLDKTSITLPVGFVGIGVGGYISPLIKPYLKTAKIIVLRDCSSIIGLPEGYDARKVIQASDLFLARKTTSAGWHGLNSKTISIFLSEHFLPRGDVAEWFSSSWAWFSKELAKVLDKLVVEGVSIQFLPMCTSRAWDDRRAAAAVTSRMVRASKSLWYYDHELTEAEIILRIRSSRLVLSQRLHGAIFATAIGCPVVPIVGHDKMKSFVYEARLTGLDYYAVSAATIEAAISTAMNESRDRAASGKTSTYPQEARNKWIAVACAVRDALSL